MNDHGPFLWSNWSAGSRNWDAKGRPSNPDLYGGKEDPTFELITYEARDIYVPQ